MNKQPIRGAEPATQLGEDQIADYLRRAPGLLRAPSAPCSRASSCRTSAAAPPISLVERQVLVLREKHAALEQKLHELIENGRANDAIADRMHRLTRRLLRARDAAGVVAALETSLREDFGASRWVLLATDPSLPALAELPQRARARRAARQRRSSRSSRPSSSPGGRAAARSATRSATTCSAAKAARSARRC